MKRSFAPSRLTRKRNSGSSEVRRLPVHAKDEGESNDAHTFDQQFAEQVLDVFLPLQERKKRIYHDNIFHLVLP